jgi:hypothetical protein
MRIFYTKYGINFFFTNRYTKEKRRRRRRRRRRVESIYNLYMTQGPGRSSQGLLLSQTHSAFAKIQSVAVAFLTGVTFPLDLHIHSNIETFLICDLPPRVRTAYHEFWKFF